MNTDPDGGADCTPGESGVKPASPRYDLLRYENADFALELAYFAAAAIAATGAAWRPRRRVITLAKYRYTTGVM